MRPLAVIVAIAGSLAGQATAAAPMLPAQSTVVTASSLNAGARPVALTFTFRYEMQCGYPGPGPVTLQLPAAMHAPSLLAKSSVLLDGKGPPSVALKGSTITVGIPPHAPVMCDVIGMGTLTVVLERSAGIGNPRSAGTYTFRVSAKPGTNGTPKLRIV